MKEKTSTTQKDIVSGDMLIGETVQKYPQIAQIMTSFGLHCIGCHVSPHETIAQGALGHGMPKEQFEEMMREVNKAAKNQPHKTQKEENDFEEQKISITQTAAKKTLEFMQKEGKNGFALRLAASPGGCAGYQYALEFDKPTENDLTFEEFGVKVVVAKNQLEMLSGVQIDFIDGLSGTGFKIENPNASGSCGCGKSFH